MDSGMMPWLFNHTEWVVVRLMLIENEGLSAWQTISGGVAMADVVDRVIVSASEAKVLTRLFPLLLSPRLH